LIAALNRKIDLIASVPLVLEYEAVLTRPEHLRAFGLTVQEVNEVLDALISVAEPIRLRFLWRPQLRDPGDEMVLETAVNGRADRLVTFNLTHLADAARSFGIQTVGPPQLWEELKNEKE
jgi:putative PIN family toxin of toxin-antitoxin system